MRYALLAATDAFKDEDGPARTPDTAGYVFVTVLGILFIAIGVMGVVLDLRRKRADATTWLCAGGFIATGIACLWGVAYALL